MKALQKTLLIAMAAAASAPALAYEQGDVLVRVGAAMVSPDVSTDAGLAPLQLDVDDNTQLGLTATYMLSPKLGVELLAATPFKHDITAGGAKVGQTKHLPPTVSAQFYPLSSPTVQPYVGVGLNYTFFFEDDTVLGDTELTDSFGLALEAGVDIKVSDKVFVNASVWKIDLNTDVKVNGVKAGEVELDPFAAMIAVGFKF
jgi:outer membrane protein